MPHCITCFLAYCSTLTSTTRQQDRKSPLNISALITFHSNDSTLKGKTLFASGKRVGRLEGRRQESGGGSRQLLRRTRVQAVLSCWRGQLKPSFPGPSTLPTHPILTLDHSQHPPAALVEANVKTNPPNLQLQGRAGFWRLKFQESTSDIGSEGQVTVASARYDLTPPPLFLLPWLSLKVFTFNFDPQFQCHINSGVFVKLIGFKC